VARWVIPHAHVIGIAEEAKKVPFDYLTKLIGACHKSGTSFVSVDKNNDIQGIVIGITEPNVWIPTNYDLTMLCLYATDCSGGRLFLQFDKVAKQKLKDGRINSVRLSKLIGKTNIDFAKRGYTADEIIYTRR